MLEQLRVAMLKIIEANSEFRETLQEDFEDDPLQQACDQADELLDRLAKVTAESIGEEVAHMFDTVPMRPEDRLNDAYLQRVIRAKVIEVLTREV